MFILFFWALAYFYRDAFHLLRDACHSSCHLQLAYAISVVTFNCAIQKNRLRIFRVASMALPEKRNAKRTPLRGYTLGISAKFCAPCGSNFCAYFALFIGRFIAIRFLLFFYIIQYSYSQPFILFNVVNTLLPFEREAAIADRMIFVLSYRFTETVQLLYYLCVLDTDYI